MKIIYVLLAAGIMFFTVDCKNKNPAPKEESLSYVTPKGVGTKEFTDLFFAEESLSEMASADHSVDDTTSAWGKFIIANDLRSKNKKEEAIQVLQGIVNVNSNAARTKIAAWNGLRELGVNAPTANVLGVILEVPQEGATEYLAMYADKTARYVNYTGSVGVWETPEPKMSELLADVMLLAQSKIKTEPLTKGRSKWLTERVRFSFLTTTGIFQTEKSFKELADRQNSMYKIFMASTLVLQEIVDKMVPK